jgi:dsRNA-specific ribonuclease
LAAGQAPAKAKSTKMSTYETNPVGALQERFQSRAITPTYQIVQAEGASHCPTFTFQVTPFESAVNRVARWFVFKPKIPILGKFWRDLV